MPLPLKRKETVGAGVRTPRWMVLAGACISRVLGGGGGGGGSGWPVAAGVVVVRSWPNFPAATQSVSLGQERPKRALVTPGMRCSVSQAPVPPTGLVAALTSPLFEERTQRVALGQSAATIWKRLDSAAVDQAPAPWVGAVETS